MEMYAERKNMKNQTYYTEKTLEYYSKWLGEDGILLQSFNGIKFVYCEDRNKAQYGYGYPFDVYMFVMEDRVIVSYGDKAKSKIEDLRDSIVDCKSVEDLKSGLMTIYGKAVGHNIKYVFNGEKINNSTSKVLGKSDYKEYEDFFRNCNPKCSNADWLQAYFEEMICENVCVGAYENSILVSCTDAPGMPYMPDEVQEIGINTLSDYRGRGYATIACQGSITEILKNGKVPQWSTSITNLASQRLAEKLGFVKLADVISITM